MAYKLLLADDSITIQKVVELTLSEEDFDVTAYGDGASALDAAKKLLPDIILADVFMPKMDGYELCAKVRQDPSLKGIPVVLLAGTFENFDDAKAAAAGADDHIIKPFESAELVSKVKRLVEKRSAEPAALAVEPVMEAEEFGEALTAEAVPEAASASDDLWSVVDMANEGQPLTGATEILTEDDLWKRARLTPEVEEAAVLPQEGPLPWEELPIEEVVEAAPVEEAVTALEAEPETLAEVAPEYEAEAVLDMDKLGAVEYAEGVEELSEIGLSGLSEPPEILKFENLDEATSAPGIHFPPPPSKPVYEEPVQPAPQAAQPSISHEMIREEVIRVARETLDKKIREAVAGISREMIEQVIWEVVPDLAEEILVREIEKLKAGIQ